MQVTETNTYLHFNTAITRAEKAVNSTDVTESELDTVVGDDVRGCGDEGYAVTGRNLGAQIHTALASCPARSAASAGTVSGPE